MSKPLPEISRCACGRRAETNLSDLNRWCVKCITSDWIGPDRRTIREAIMAWNRVMELLHHVKYSFEDQKKEKKEE